VLWRGAKKVGSEATSVRLLVMLMDGMIHLLSLLQPQPSPLTLLYLSAIPPHIGPTMNVVIGFTAPSTPIHGPLSPSEW